MSNKQYDSYSEKHPDNKVIDEKVAEPIRKRSDRGKLTCAAAFGIVDELNISPREVGRNIDLLEIRVQKCQLGLHGYGPEGRLVKAAESVTEDLEEAIKEKLENGKLPCNDTWLIAEKFKLKKLEVASACEALKIKVNKCQLGTF